MKVVIIDDEEGARNALSGILNLYFPDLKIIGTADSVNSGLALIQKSDPEVIFLDVRMPDGSGFDLVSQLKEPDRFNIVFVTAYDEYAIEAIRVSAIDYLLKPIRVKELKQAVSKIPRRKEKPHTTRPEQSRIEALKQNVKGKAFQRLVVPNVKGFEVFEISNILYFEGKGNYTRIVLNGRQEVLVAKVLKEYDEMLSAQHFFRIHRSFLVNSNHVVGYQKGKTGQVKMSNGDLLNVSREKKDDFMSFFLSNGGL